MNVSILCCFEFIFFFPSIFLYTKYVFQNFIHTCVHVHVCMCSCMYFCACLHAYIHMCMHPCICVCMYAYMFHVLFTHSDYISTNVQYEHDVIGKKDIGAKTQSSRKWLI